MTSYKRRIIDNELDELISALPAISLEGAKGVGKTETGLQRSNTVYRLDDPDELDISLGNPYRVVQGNRTILIDEWQRLPQSWDLVRRAVDEGSPAGSFLLTGSSAPLHASTHSGAGRIVTIPMRPLSLAERDIETPTVSLSQLLSGKRLALNGATSLQVEDYVKEIVASGFPGFRKFTGRALNSQLDGYIRRISERDFEEVGYKVRNPAVLMRWLMAYAAATSTISSYEVIRDAATSGQGDKPAKSTTIPYRDVLQRLWIIDPVPAWLPIRNHISKLSSPSKHQLADPALAARILGATTESLLESNRDGTMLGQLFESLITLCVRVYAQHCEASVKHLRTQGGNHEIDLIVERSDQKVLAIEVKLSRSIQDSDVKHLHWLKERIGDELLDAVVINTGKEAYRRKDGIGVIPAALLGP